jgi:serine/threonine protein kinase
LKSEIENRVGLEAPFEEKELQYLLFELLDLAKEFEKTGQKAGNIKPDNILINNEGEVSIITRHSYPGFVEAYASALYDKEPSFLCRFVALT